MAHPKPEEIWPVDTVVRSKKTGQFAIIKQQTFVKDGKGFLHYLGEIEGKSGQYCIIHDEWELECEARK